MKIEHDFHIHTKRSLCAGENGGLYPDYIKLFREQGLKKIGFTDHFWDERAGYEALRIDCKEKRALEWYYTTQNFAHVSTILEEMRSVPSEGIEVFFGAEADYDSLRGEVALTEETAEKFDFVTVPNSHTHMTMPKDLYLPIERHRDFTVKAFRDIVSSKVAYKILSIAHPFYPVACPHYKDGAFMSTITTDTYLELFEMAAKKNIAIEINTSCIFHVMRDKDAVCLEEYARLIDSVRRAGAKLVFGSDAHSVDAHENYNDICAWVVDTFSLTEADMTPLPTK
jgi:histidinol phosphatase-like PHP family hydrolase